jgi:hypothetical protein
MVIIRKDLGWNLFSIIIGERIKDYNMWVNTYQFNKEIIIFWCGFGAGAAIVLAMSYIFAFLRELDNK